MRVRSVQMATVVCLTLFSGDTLRGQSFAPGWYDVVLKSRHHLTVKVLRDETERLVCTYQGEQLEIPKNQIQALRSLLEPSASRDGSLKPDDTVKILDAIEDLAARNFDARRRSVELLEERFPACRKLLHRALKHKQDRVRKLVVKLLGERGERDFDLDVVVAVLRDHDAKVRLAAVMAVRQLGPGRFEEILAYLRREPVANNRKMAVKTFQLWNEPKGLDPVLEVLEREKDPAVRRFCVAALHSLTRRNYGDDVEAWRDYQRALRLRKEVREADGARRNR